MPRPKLTPEQGRLAYHRECLLAIDERLRAKDRDLYQIGLAVLSGDPDALRQELSRRYSYSGAFSAKIQKRAGRRREPHEVALAEYKVLKGTGMTAKAAKGEIAIRFGKPADAATPESQERFMRALRERARRMGTK